MSVVVSTFNRPARLATLLRALREQTLETSCFEVIVVDNGSAELHTARVVAAEHDLGHLELRSLRHETTLGPAGGRNSGWRLARAPLVAFTDDDCRPAPEWLVEALAAAGAHPGAVVQGRTIPDPREPTDGLFSHTVSVARLGPQYETCNMLYPRPLLQDLGGFDQRFGLRPAGEDTDLAWRALERGARTVFAPRAIVYHAVQRLGPVAALRLAARWGDGLRVYSRHPQTRTMLYRGIFWNVWHYLMWRSLLALAAPRWLRRLVLTRHLAELRRRAQAAGAGGDAIPYLIVHDLVECGAIARGALRYRTLVL